MAPLFTMLFSRNAHFDAAPTIDEFRAQWITPSDVFSVLLLLGGEVVGRAIAQLAGSGVAPLAFSFGWVSYSIAALVSAVGENKLMPPTPDCRCKVINGRSGYPRDNSSWILGRIMRDFDYWQDAAVATKLEQVLTARHAELKKKDPAAARPPVAGLIVSVYEPSTAVAAGTVARDHVFWTGPPVILAQLLLGGVALGVHGEWGTLLVTAGGTALALATGRLSQWRREKWACRPGAGHSYVLTRGNGSQHAVVVRGNAHGLNLEDLASGQTNAAVAASLPTRLGLLLLAVLWVLLLVTAAGIRRDTWFLLGVGTLGMLANVYVAGAPRRPESFGIPLEFVEVLGDGKVMEALKEVERRYRHVGRALLPEFFPGPLRPKEQDEWDEIERTHAQSEAADKAAAPEQAAVGEGTK